ncbi:unnamed protein product [Dovyalis caffra]|uniref:YDG domain-containing protein n=1 Tax=Dovyalis caffra TaxID=77055 RepID=A0AAV1QQY6_9ROSI|nr:unnamed protein product [Dovyalis caffra]
MDESDSGRSSKLKQPIPKTIRQFPGGRGRFPIVVNSIKRKDNIAFNCLSMEAAPKKFPPSGILKRFSQRDFPAGRGKRDSFSVSKDGFSDTILMDEPLENRVAGTIPRTCPRSRIMKGVSSKQDFPVGKQDSCYPFEDYVTTDYKGNQHSNFDSEESVPYNGKAFADPEPLGADIRMIKSPVYGDIDEDQESSASSRSKVKKVLGLYQEILTKLLGEKEAKLKGPKAKIYIEAATILKSRHKWSNTSKRIGHIPGVEVGDRFRFRAELNIIGLHGNFFTGIDYMTKDGRKLATCIVATKRYANDMKSSDVLIYSGYGGNPSILRKQLPLRDQKLEHGNLALRNSMDSRIPVRVIRQQNFKGSKASISAFKGINRQKNLNPLYVYDGLYLVEKYWQERGNLGKLVFKFQLIRILGQPKLTRIISK